MMAYDRHSLGGSPAPPGPPPPPPLPYGASQHEGRGRSRSPGRPHRRSPSPPRGGRRSMSPRDNRPGGHYNDARGPPIHPSRGGYDSHDRGYGGGSYDRGYDREGYNSRSGYGGGGDGYGGPRHEGGRGYGGGYGGRGGGRRSPPPRRRYDVIKGNDEQRETTSCLYVGNLPYSFREEDVRDLFDRYGKLTSVSVPHDRFTGRNKGFAFVAYEDRRDADDAKNKYDGFTVEGRRLKIDWDIGLNQKDEIKSVHKPARGPSVEGGRERGRSPPPPNGRRSPQYSPYTRRSPSPPPRPY
ncbi:hypothetical protein DFS34DRAFT_363582 [Phlyctochytrium arcticum]|nr:hypothetical protein DFS34DRAFT_363582 [Phlyctochytrium arcticum]